MVIDLWWDFEWIFKNMVCVCMCNFGYLMILYYIFGDGGYGNYGLVWVGFKVGRIDR